LLRWSLIELWCIPRQRERERDRSTSGVRGGGEGGGLTIVVAPAAVVGLDAQMDA